MRKNKQIKIENEGRDKGKVFFIEEMPPRKAHEWSLKAILAVTKNDPTVPDEFLKSGLAGMAQAGLRALLKVNFDEAMPLLDELLACVKYIPDPSKPSTMLPIVGNTFASQIEEALTFYTLEKEVFKLHVDFFPSAAA